MINLRHSPLFVFGWLLIAVAAADAAPLRIPHLLSDHMVLQQGCPVRIWGWADPQQPVTVEFAGQEKQATANSSGEWTVWLDPLKASTEPRPLTIRSAPGKESIQLHDVLVGEVWVSCGQSNMMFPLMKARGGAEAVTASPQFPDIRLFNEPAHRQTNAPATDVNAHWQVATPTTVGEFSAVSYFFGYDLNQHLHVPIGLINAVAIMPGESWIDEQTLLATPALRGLTNAAIPAVTTYNAMIAPLTPFAIRGAIYYQGEYNAGRGRQYRDIMPGIIRSWRARWDEGPFPFLIVQLPGFSGHDQAPDKKLDMPASVLRKVGAPSAWAELREAQWLTAQTVTNTGLAVTIDLGDPFNIHPANKIPVADRLASQARALAYGEKLVASGPTFTSLECQDHRLLLHFQNVGDGLVARDGALKGFELAGPDHQYVEAQAEIRGATVVVSQPTVREPVLVRYAWANYPDGNLYNTNGLPAAPFRAFVPGRAFQVDKFTFDFRNPDFEEEQGWHVTGGAARTNTRASTGHWSMELPPKGAIAQAGIVSTGMYGYDWNSDLLEPDHFRPGTIVGYSVAVASRDGESQPVYMRLCANPSAEGYQYWGIPEITTASAQFTRRAVTICMRPNFEGIGGGGVGAFFANLHGATPVYLDNFSQLTVIRPRLELSDLTPIDLGGVVPNTPATAPGRTITNGQTLTLPDCRTDSGVTQQVATVLYGLVNVHPTTVGWFTHVSEATDNVGAVLIGKDAALFEFVSAHRGATPQELKLIGADDQPGLRGGLHPESEPLIVRFRGAPRAGDYVAAVRLVTQAGNCGTLSTGRTGEPAEYLWYVDLPVRVRVGGAPPQGNP